MQDGIDTWNGFGDEWLDAQSPERVLVIVERALREADLDEVPEGDTPEYDELFVPAFSRIAIRMALEDLLKEMANKGLIHPEVLKDGSIGYEVTELGEALYHQEMAAEES